MSWWTRNFVGVDPNPEPSFLDVLDGVTLPAADGTPAVHVNVLNGQAHTYVYDPTLGPLDGRSTLERFPIMPRAAQPVIPAAKP
ncbi:hypothetical protein [Oerskovia enterophila]|uniref:hypothetical protein n=1 Tax=Oerskovia enterophila TaxID=43678 RepID=UPI003803E9E3